MTTPAPYGFWKSPITSDLIAGGTVGLTDIRVDGDNIYWLEARPAEGGRCVVAGWDGTGAVPDAPKAPFDVQTRVHNYGGAAYTVSGGTLYFSNKKDQQMYRQQPGMDPVAITQAAPAGQKISYADIVFDQQRNQLICIQEAHRNPKQSQQAVNTIVSLDPGGSRVPKELVWGNDFYSSPRLSPDGSKLAWLTWNFPSMPWIGTELWVGDISPQGDIVNPSPVAGGLEESIFQPEWSPDNVLHFVSDRRNWWNLYKWENGKVDCLLKMEAEFGVAQWLFGLSTYGFDGNWIVCTYTAGGEWKLASLDRTTRQLSDIVTPYRDFSYVQTRPGSVVVRAGSPTQPRSIVLIDLKTPAPTPTVLKTSVDLSKTPDIQAYISIPRHIPFPTSHELTAYAFLYLPVNRDYVPLDGEVPPLLVTCHGGPTDAASSTLNLLVQYWTSRGFAVLDVNYGGSTGYGREYRNRLEGQWGVVDLDDCVNGATFLVQQGTVDEKRLAARGTSAGGYTTMCALTFRPNFRAGASTAGISDLTKLTIDTHKFESHYLDWLVGPLPASAKIYHDRSPINFPQKISSPIIFFQGADDPVVPSNQSERMVQVLLKRGLTVGYLLFDGEQHGLRQGANIKLALDAELSFFAMMLVRAGLHY